MVLGVAAGIHLVLEAEEAEVAGAVRAEAGDLDVVTEEIGVPGDLVVLPGEELLLVIEARTPGQVAADLEILAEAVAHHVGRVHTLARLGVVGAAGGMDVMIAGPPAAQGRVDPAVDLRTSRSPSGVWRRR